MEIPKAWNVSSWVTNLRREKKMNEKLNLRCASNNIYIQNSQILLWKFVNVIWDEIEFSTFPISSNFQQQQ